MNKYYIANDKINLKCYPNYSFEIADVNSDGKMEFISMNQNGNLLSVFNLDGEVLFEKVLENNGNWGTAIFCAADINGDSRDEIIVQNGANVIALDENGNKIRERAFGGCQKDAYNISIPILGSARTKSPDEKSIIVCAAGGEIYAIDKNFGII